MSKIELHNTSFGYTKDQLIFKNLSLSFNKRHEDKGHIIALLGESGVGKSTLLKLMLGNLSPSAGSVDIVSKKNVVSYLPQEPVLMEFLSPLDNAIYFKSVKAYKYLFDNKTFETFKKSLGLEEVLKSKTSVNNLSGGQRQRIALLRALSINPDTIMMDEPAKGLDARTRAQFLNQLREIILGTNTLGIYVTHHLDEAQLVADDIAYIYRDELSKDSSIYIDSLNNFLEKPKLLEALEAVKYPNAKIMKCTFDRDNQIQLAKGEDFFFISLDENNIGYSDTLGFDFNILYKNDKYAQIELLDGQRINLMTKSISGCKLFLKGKVLRFNKNGKFEDIIEVVNYEL
ncbi:ATP-binding cassette domain-containing protein [Winogradskyella tangerina]|uniref:ATP-binding cassette domain-containing protein n=1 Tax=Winogradskyella tangerina TaxID=2023240 RepID=UPI0013008A5E|nr:ABC transporter ATP-binding protein [Winogradskyella tangerina]